MQARQIAEPHVECSTHYNTVNKELLLHVERAFIQNPLEANPDPFISASIGRQKFTTKTKRNTNNPEWDEKFKFDVLQHDGSTHPLVLTLWDSDIIGKDHFGTVEVPVQFLLAVSDAKLFFVLPPAITVEPDQEDYPAFDRSGLTDDAIRLVREQLTKKKKLHDILPEDLAKDMRDFLGNPSHESLQTAEAVINVWRKKNGSRFEIVPITAVHAAAAVAQKAVPSRSTALITPQKPKQQGTGQFLADYAPLVKQTNVAGVPTTENELRRLFEQFDADHNGLIRKQELERFCLALDSMGVDDEPKNIRKLITQFDRNGDGLDFQEFAIIMLKLAQR
eukprot:TRINITY_DN8030_c0_g1_i1.p1 TRINITY_DN8030_c0_g1~~TRINITY_DN8030_c0_g1_i1.p1  ORF type:complete len:335 (-),score=70.42 TRINITY_DN8030_c0_g1_i1:12-1016(-)